MSAPTGTTYPGTLDTGSATIGTSVSTGQVIASAYADTSSSAILAVEVALGTNPQGSDPSVGAALVARARKTDVQNQALTYAADSGSANTYVVTLSPAPTAGMVVVFKAANANTGASTLNVNSLGAKSLVKNGSVALASGDINAGQIYTAIFDGVNFQASGSIGSSIITLTGDVTGSGAASIATTIANSGVTAGTYPKVTVNAKGLVTAGTTLSPSDIPATYAGGASIATVGTITTGTWQAAIIAVTYGGTGASTASGARTNLGAAASGANADITSLTGLTTALSVVQGGTGSTTAGGARTNLSAAASGANSDITSLSGLTTPLSVPQGGTGSTTASGALSNLGGATSGANSNITSLSGLTTPLSVPQGGTGVSTITGLVKGSGTSAFVAAVAGTDYLVGAGTTAGTYPKVTVNANGLVTAGAQLTVASKTAAYTIAATDDVVLASASSAAFTVTLPTSVGITGKVYYIKKTDTSAHVVTLATTSSQTIDGATTQLLSYPNQELYIVSDGANWQILAQVNVIPPGTVMLWISNTIPNGWLLCNGNSYSTTTYPGLFNTIQYTYGGSGSSFNVPNCNGKTAFGSGTDGSHASNPGTTYSDALGGYGGESSHTLVTTEMPEHTHTESVADGVGSYSGIGGSETNGTSYSSTTITQSAGGSGAHNTMGPFVNINYIIKY